MPNLSMPLFSYTECRTSPILFCNHYYYELFIKPGESADTFVNPCCIFAEVRNYSDLQCFPMSNFCRPMFEIFVSQYIEIYMGYIPPSYQRPRGSTARALCKSHFSQYYRSCNAASEYVMLIFKATILNKFEKKAPSIP